MTPHPYKVVGDPWEVLAQDWPNVKLKLRQLPSDLDGYTTWPYNGSAPIIVLCSSLGPVELRCMLAHEIKHLECAHPPGSPVRAEERTVRRALALWLLPDIEEVAHAVRKRGLDAASGFDVTHAVLQDRMAMLSAPDAAIVRRLGLRAA